MMSSKEAEFKDSTFIKQGNHAESDYLGLIKQLVISDTSRSIETQQHIDRLYALLLDEIKNNINNPVQEIAFGTSGWRGILGKDIYARSVAQVTRGIVEMYEELGSDHTLASLLGVENLREAQSRGCVLGFDNRFAGELLAGVVAGVLTQAGFKVYYAGESTTGVLSAAVLIHKCAFSINLTPSHNPLDYGGFKFNAADGGPAAGPVTAKITENARRIVHTESGKGSPHKLQINSTVAGADVISIDALANWQQLVKENEHIHGLSIDKILSSFKSCDELTVVVDCVHGASRLHVKKLLGDCTEPRLHMLRDTPDVTFGGVAPEPSTVNMLDVVHNLSESTSRLKLGAIIDPDGDRIRFTDGTTEISMNQFGAMAYHYLHEYKMKKGLVAKTVATSNLANSIAEKLGEKVFEPSVGFKNFKPVIGQAVVFFEESDGISILGHTPEKDAYIGLVLALDMVLTTGLNLGDYLRQIEGEYGSYFPDRDGVEVAVKGDVLLALLARLEKYEVGSSVLVGRDEKKIVDVLSIDGRKMILEDGSWLMIRPSGTEPKVRFYVESRTSKGTADLVNAAQNMLKEVGVLA
ncbi:MAG: phosphomannomutase [Desulforhopalus sp.]|jgi:phosphomannomutase